MQCRQNCQYVSIWRGCGDGGFYERFERGGYDLFEGVILLDVPLLDDNDVYELWGLSAGKSAREGMEWEEIMHVAIGGLF